MFLQAFYTPGLSIYSYLVGDKVTRRAAIIDPTRDVSQYLQFAQQEGLVITDCLETHVHADFVSGAKELKHHLDGKLIIHCSSMGGKEWLPQYADRAVKEGDSIDFGRVRLEALHTPGHTPEHLIWLCYDETRDASTPCLAFTGDLLFVGSIGRPDLLGDKELKTLGKQLYDSLFIKLTHLPDFLEIFPAHGAGSLCGKALSARPSSTLGYERLFNPFLQKKPIDQWLKELLSDIPAVPINFLRLKKVNVQGPPLLINQAVIASEFVVVDVRHPDLFARAHIKGSLNIPLGAAFCNWASSVLVENIPLKLVASNMLQMEEAILNLQLIGFDQVTRRIVWDENLVLEEFTFETLLSVNPSEAVKMMDEPTQKSFLMDVRTSSEWRSCHSSQAHHIELALLPEKIGQIPADSSIYVLCGSGYRSSIASSLLRKRGFDTVVNIKGGMSAWIKAHLPVVKESE